MTVRWAIIAGALAALVGVLLGTFGAHVLSGILTTSRLEIWETAVRYQLVHALGLLMIAALAGREDGPWLRGAAVCMAIGLVVFPGSLYLLCLTGAGWLGAFTPLGGAMWIAGWLLLVIHGACR